MICSDSVRPAEFSEHQRQAARGYHGVGVAGPVQQVVALVGLANERQGIVIVAKLTHVVAVVVDRTQRFGMVATDHTTVIR